MSSYLNSLLYPDIEKLEHYWNGIEADNRITSYQEKLNMLFDIFEHISSQNSVLILVWDAVASQIIYAVDKKVVVGHDMSLYTAEDGLHFSLSNVHTDYLTSGHLMQQISFEQVTANKGMGQNKTTVNIDGRYKKRNGEYFHYLQQTVALELAKNQPPVFVSYIHDITYLKKENSANLIITTPDEIKLWNFNFHNQSLEPMQLLTVQEKKVLSYLSKGKDSKEIAKELYISSHTVDTHRRNLLKKTNCIDTSGLITYAKLVGLF